MAVAMVALLLAVPLASSVEGSAGDVVVPDYRPDYGMIYVALGNPPPVQASAALYNVEDDSEPIYTAANVLVKSTKTGPFTGALLRDVPLLEDGRYYIILSYQKSEIVTPEFRVGEGVLVKFQNYDGEVLQMFNYAMGELPEYLGSVPVRPADEEHVYVFAGWEPEVVPVSGAATYTAVYEAVPSECVISFYDEDGETLLDQETVAYGEMPVYKGATPKKASDEQNRYAFAGWTLALSPATGDASYTARFSAVPFDADFNYDGRVDLRDMTLFKKAVKAGGTDKTFDITHDGKVNLRDVVLMKKILSLKN
ncbi:MAG: dockerin type I repeat-containing protein [Candidatus Methanomethylophilaceae archaeon]|nr:dockerin type I repeat-containing protein [Candidatus Methanomethylophilaceae archaeon]